MQSKKFMTKHGQSVCIHIQHSAANIVQQVKTLTTNKSVQNNVAECLKVGNKV